MTNRWQLIEKYIVAATVTLLFVLPNVSTGQQNSDSASEVYLSFQYRGIVSSYVTSYYKDDQFYLPVSELFTLLNVNHNIEQGSLSISGNYLGEKEYLIDFRRLIARAGDTQLQLQAEDILIRDIDYFLKPSVFEQLFGLRFTTDFNNLALDLETEDKMPIISQYEREQARKKLNREEPLNDRNYYPLQYDRDYSSLDGAFLDYNLSTAYSNNSQLFTFNNAFGAEFLAGDVQGSVFGALSQQQSSVTTNGLRWRYVQRDNAYFSSIIGGQTNTEGISNRSITGIKISNKPVEPRLLFDRFPIEGTVPAQSEVELYLNNRLVDFQVADESGNYRFLVPLTYGSTNYSIRAYTPSGQAIERNSRIQVPFDYLPPGEVDYSISGGRLENPILGSEDRGYVGGATVSSGLTNWLTASASTEYLSDFHSSRPSFTGTLNARLFSNYLLSANVNSENFYRLTSSVVYNSGASWSLSYDYNPGESRIYNLGGSDHLARVNLFTPFQIGPVPLNIRWASTYQREGDARLLRYSADLNSRLGRLNIRLGYQDQQAGDLQFETTTASRLTNSYTYAIGRRRSIPSLLRGVFVRGMLSYFPGRNEFEELELQLSRDLLDTGRIQLTYSHNFLGNFNTIGLNLTVDFNKIRSNTTSRVTGSEFFASQNFRGSIGYDPYGEQFILNNRQQVGQAGAAVRLFVDNNNDGTYQDSTDNVITDPAVRLNRSGGRTFVKNGVNYISQLLPYYRYDLEINKSALSNPLLVANLENFSIITDPNQYKTIEIPFYLSGVISGKVERVREATRSALSGVRLYLESNYKNEANRKPFSKELRTFSDGSFYTYEVPPGRYRLFIDPGQLQFLQATSDPDTMDVFVDAKAEGDFIEGLNFTVTSVKEKPVSADPAVTQSQPKPDTTSSESEITGKDIYYKIQLASFKTRKKAVRVAKEAAQRLGGSFSVIRNSNNGLFAIRSIPTANKNQAIERIISYHNSDYKSAALVVMKNDYKMPQKVSRFIQIGAFTAKSLAESFAKRSAQQLGVETAITFSKKSDLYKVYLNKVYLSENERENKLQNLRQLYSFDDAYINKNDRIQVAAVEDKDAADRLAGYIQEELGTSAHIFFDSQDKLYNIELLDIRDQKRRLKEIKDSPSPYADAFISDLKNELNVDPTERAMDFSFRIEVEGVSEKADQTFLSSLENQPDLTLDRPVRDRVVFSDISSWKQAQALQRKLSGITTIGHPIVILIEKN